jgi:hypothetical protein
MKGVMGYNKDKLTDEEYDNIEAKIRFLKKQSMLKNIDLPESYKKSPHMVSGTTMTTKELYRLYTIHTGESVSDLNKRSVAATLGGVNHDNDIDIDGEAILVVGDKNTLTRNAFIAISAISNSYNVNSLITNNGTDGIKPSGSLVNDYLNNR